MIKTKRILKATVFTLICMMLFFMQASLVHAEGIKWHKYQAGKSEAADKGKKIFINFYANWCPFCKKMDNNTFTDKKIVKFLNDYFVSIGVNIDIENKNAAKYKVEGLPTIMVLTEKGEVIDSLQGYIPPIMVIKFLEYAESESYKRQSFRDFIAESMRSK